MAYREIPEGSIEIQTGLYLKIVQGTYISYGTLYSSDGYCFYDKTVEVFDEEGNVIPEENILPSQRLYMQYTATSQTDIDDLNATYVSVPVDDSYEIVSIGNKEEMV